MAGPTVSWQLAWNSNPRLSDLKNSCPHLAAWGRTGFHAGGCIHFSGLNTLRPLVTFRATVSGGVPLEAEAKTAVGWESSVSR